MQKAKKFFKKKKVNKTPSTKSPNIFRFITERSIIFFLLCSVFLWTIGMAGLDTYQKLQEKNRLGAQREKLVSEMQRWERIVETYKGYRDGYFRLAVLAYQLGKIDESRNYLKKALDLDPNFEEGRKLELLLK